MTLALVICAVELFALVLAVVELRRAVARIHPPSMTDATHELRRIAEELKGARAALEKHASVANIARQEQRLGWRP